MDACADDFTDKNRVVAMFNGPHNSAFDKTEGVFNDRTAGFLAKVKLNVFKLVAYSTQRLEEVLGEVFLPRFQEAKGEDAAGFEHGVGSGVIFDAVDHQGRGERSLHHPTGGKAIHCCFTVFDAADVESVGNLAQESFFSLFV